jgi:hypothetical protein
MSDIGFILKGSKKGLKNKTKGIIWVRKRTRSARPVGNFAVLLALCSRSVKENFLCYHKDGENWYFQVKIPNTRTYDRHKCLPTFYTTDVLQKSPREIYMTMNIIECNELFIHSKLILNRRRRNHHKQQHAIWLTTGS